MKKIGRQVNFLGTSEFNQRNGEGAFIKLKNGSIMFGFTEFTANAIAKGDTEIYIKYNDGQRQFNYKNSSIYKCCQNKPHFNTAYGFKWKYAV